MSINVSLVVGDVHYYVQSSREMHLHILHNRKASNIPVYEVEYWRTNIQETPCNWELKLFIIPFMDEINAYVHMLLSNESACHHARCVPCVAGRAAWHFAWPAQNSHYRYYNTRISFREIVYIQPCETCSTSYMHVRFQCIVTWLCSLGKTHACPPLREGEKEPIAV